MKTTLTCPDCGKQYNPLNMCEVIFHSGNHVKKAPKPGKPWGWQHQAKLLKEKCRKLEAENRELSKALSQALGADKSAAG